MWMCPTLGGFTEISKDFHGDLWGCDGIDKQLEVIYGYVGTATPIVLSEIKISLSSSCPSFSGLLHGSIPLIAETWMVSDPEMTGI